MTAFSPPSMPSLPTFSPGEANSLLRSAADVSRQRLHQNYEQVFELVRAALLEKVRAEEAYAPVLRFIEQHSHGMREDFIRHLAQAQQQAIERIVAPGFDVASTIKIDMMSLSLVDDTDDKAGVIAANAARRMRGLVEDTSKEIELILSQLSGREQVARTDNPYGAEVVLPSLVHVAVESGLAQASWVPFLTIIERDFGEELGRVQLAVLEHFATRGLDARAIRKVRGVRKTGGVTVGTGVPGPDGVRTPTPRPAVSDQLAGGAGRPGSAEAAALAAGGVEEAGAVLRELLGRMQAQDGGMAFPIIQRGPPPPQLLDAIAQLQGLGSDNVHGARVLSSSAGPGARAGDPGTINAWREHLVGQSSRTVDKLTIEITGMMFDKVMADTQLPAEMKALISRLQFPILKAALLDAAFFASPAHPARRLIDRIATASAGWEPYGDENVKFRAEVERLVQQVLDEFEKDPGLFERVLAEFDAFLAVIAPRESDPIARAKKALEEAEKREVMVINTTIQVRKVFDRIDLEGYLREFLLGPWVQVLVTANLRDDETSGYSKRFREVIHEIVWSVQPKATAAERQRLVELIPTMTRTTRDGMGLIRMPQHEQDQFLKSLMGSHAMAVKPVDQATYIRSSLQSSDVQARVNRMQVTGTFPLTNVPGGIHIDGNAVRQAAAEHAVELTIPVPLAEPESATRQGSTTSMPTVVEVDLTRWARGSWFEIWDGNKFVKARLRWISPLRTMYMFSAGADSRPHVMSPELIQSYLRRKFIRPLETMPLTERVAGAVLAEFRNRPEQAAEVVTRTSTPHA